MGWEDVQGTQTLGAFKAAGKEDSSSFHQRHKGKSRVRHEDVGAKGRMMGLKSRASRVLLPL